MRLGKIATALGVFSFICVLVIGFSQVHDDGINSPLVNFISSLFNFEKDFQKSEAVMKSVSIFDIYEENIRFLLKITTIILAILSGIIAVLASRQEASSLWYSIAVFTSGFALTEISYFLAGSFVIICLVIIMSFRKWRISKE